MSLKCYYKEALRNIKNTINIQEKISNKKYKKYIDIRLKRWYYKKVPNNKRTKK